VPSTYTFNELHVAIQDAMGWYDEHLHEFRIKLKNGETLELGGSPMGDCVEGILPDSKFKISKYESVLPKSFTYTYDFGDNWEHKIDFEKVLPAEERVWYPICVKGKRACPPEDCGGVWGYEELLQILANPEHDQYEEKAEWMESQYDDPFDSEEFVPDDVYFRERKEL
jgi:hypothetical protein